jgi:hypothetical protein
MQQEPLDEIAGVTPAPHGERPGAATLPDIAELLVERATKARERARDELFSQIEKSVATIVTSGKTRAL